ncbi:MAG TPA: hypothetical protein VJC39_04475 [Candidatus Nanoarchaeia archaeon]|nr:hypothetical protein [Candidatus Nanoarchaeia archaeon]
MLNHSLFGSAYQLMVYPNYIWEIKNWDNLNYPSLEKSLLGSLLAIDPEFRSYAESADRYIKRMIKRGQAFKQEKTLIVGLKNIFLNFYISKLETGKINPNKVHSELETKIDFYHLFYNGWKNREDDSPNLTGEWVHKPTYVLFK